MIGSRPESPPGGAFAPLLALAAAWVLVTPAVSADMATVKSRIFETLATPSVSSSSIASLRTSLQADGRWPDVDYASTVATNWPQTTHLTRMRDLARAYAKPGSPLEGDAGLLADALKAYDAWIAEDPSSTNWYHNQINTPQKLGETMVLLEPTPISPPSGPIQWLLQGPPAESNLLAAATRQGR